mmetsp:Transcript_6483/g.12212  ORF Transcript_6483/g.12212 Transcript_6483/m.12212 type:complete len:402 (+) Transcript_6483:285-1490(+)
MTSKLDYLSKYLDKKANKKKKKEKEKKKISGLPGPIGSYEEEDEDGPTVVIPDISTDLEAFGRDSDTRYKQGQRDKEMKENESFSSDSSRGEKRGGKRKRYDSDDEGECGDSQQDSQNYMKGQRMEYHHNLEKSTFDKSSSRKRYESDDKEEEHVTNVRHNDEEKVNGYRRDPHENIHKQNSSRNSSRRGRRFDSDDDDDHDDELNVVSKNDDERRHQSKVRKMTSGHNAGLQSSADFRKAEEIIQKSKAGSITEIERGETVYRNKDGQTISVAMENDAKSSEVSSPSWNLGTAQKQQMIDRLKEEQAVTLGAFSRSVADVDQHRRDVIRKGDPMARYDTNNATKKTYKGPPPKPNRFRIPPGYRWDGIDRGNGFEDQVLASLYAKGRKKEESYKWSCADM